MPFGYRYMKWCTERGSNSQVNNKVLYFLRVAPIPNSAICTGFGGELGNRTRHTLADKPVFQTGVAPCNTFSKVFKLVGETGIAPARSEDGAVTAR